MRCRRSSCRPDRTAPHRPGAGVGALTWAVYNGLLGYLGGQAFEQQTWKGLLLSFGVAAAVAGLVELVRWLRGRRREPAPASAGC